MLVLTDYKTGFVKSGAHIAYFILTAIFIAALVFAAAFLSVRCESSGSSQSFYLTTSLSALALGITLIINSFTSNYVAVPAILKTVCFLLGILSGVFFIAFAVRPVFHFPLSAKFLALPLSFLIVKSAVVFIKSSYYAVIYDTLFDVGSYCLLMLLFLELARTANGFGQKNSIKRVAFFSVLSSVLLITVSLPKLILLVFFPVALHDGIGDSVLFLFFGIFVVSLLFSRIEFTSRGGRKIGIYYVGKH